MSYYSTLVVEPYTITKNPEKIRRFNELARFIEFKEEPKDPKVKEIFEKIKGEVKDIFTRDYFLDFFSYRLSPEGHLGVEIEEGKFDNDLSDIKNYADYILAQTLKYFADKPTLLRFIGEDFEEWGFFIDPDKKTVVPCGIIPVAAGHTEDEIRIINRNNIETYKKVK